MATITHNPEDISPLGLYYNIYFKDTTDTEELDAAYRKSIKSFPIIFASSEASVYKICHHFYDKFKLRKPSIKMLDGLAIESYFDAFADHKYNLIKMEQLRKEGVLNDISGKWLVIPKMKEQWNPRLVYFFCDTLKNAGVVGLIFYSEGVNNFGKTLLENTVLDVCQFPQQIYKLTRSIEDDNF